LTTSLTPAYLASRFGLNATRVRQGVPPTAVTGTVGTTVTDAITVAISDVAMTAVTVTIAVTAETAVTATADSVVTGNSCY
jgi:hypothetical protein